MFIEFFAYIGLIFGFLAGLIAFLITLKEWKSHGFEGRELWEEPIKRGIGTFVFFFALSLFIGYSIHLVV